MLPKLMGGVSEKFGEEFEHSRVVVQGLKGEVDRDALHRSMAI